VYTLLSILQVFACVCVCKWTFFSKALRSFGVQTRTHTQTLSNTALVRYGPTTDTRRRRVGARNISIRTCAVQPQRESAVANGNSEWRCSAARRHTALSTNARGWFDIYYYYYYYYYSYDYCYSPWDIKINIYDIILYLKTFSITRGMVLGNVFVIERRRSAGSSGGFIWHDVASSLLFGGAENRSLSSKYNILLTTTLGKIEIHILDSQFSYGTYTVFYDGDRFFLYLYVGYHLLEH